MSFKINQILKAVSLLLVVSFLTEQLSFAAEEIKPLALNLFEKPSISLKFPDSVAQIEDTYEAGGKLVYLIQDAHTNESGQLNLSKVLDTLLSQDKQLKYIFSEAGVGNNSLSFLRGRVGNGRDRSLRIQVANKYLKQGILHGSEYLDLTSDHKFTLWGVENPKLYIQALESYKKVAKDRERYEAYLKKIDQTISTLKPRIYNPNLLDLDTLHEKFLKEEISLTAYGDTLLNMSQRTGHVHQHVPAASTFYPHLTALKDLKALESTINFTKANEEQIKAILSLSKEDQEELLSYKNGRPQGDAPTVLSSQDHKEERAFYSLLEEKLLGHVNLRVPSSGTCKLTCPNLTLYFQYLKKAKVLDPKSILKEQSLLEEEVYDQLAKTNDERWLVRCSKQLKSLKKLLNLTMTPEEYKTYKEEPLTITSLTGFLNKKIMDLHNFYERATFLEPEIGRASCRERVYVLV